MHFEGVRTIARSLEHVAERLGDARFLAESLREHKVEDVQLTSADEVSWRVRPALALLGSIDTKMTLIERDLPHTIRWRLANSGMGSTSVATSTLALSGDGDSTQVRWSADVVEMTGMMKLIPASMIQGQATKVINEIWDTVAKRVEEI